MCTNESRGDLASWAITTVYFALKAPIVSRPHGREILNVFISDISSSHTYSCRSLPKDVIQFSGLEAVVSERDSARQAVTEKDY